MPSLARGCIITKLPKSIADRDNQPEEIGVEYCLCVYMSQISKYGSEVGGSFILQVSCQTNRTLLQFAPFLVQIAKPNMRPKHNESKSPTYSLRTRRIAYVYLESELRNALFFRIREENAEAVKSDFAS